MLKRRFSWQEELEIIDSTMKAISSVSDPEELVEKYWDGIGKLIAVEDYIALSRRNVEPPQFLITRSSMFTEHFNPWTERDKLPKLAGGLLGQIAYGNRPFVIEDLPAQLSPDDPAHAYLKDFQALIASPNYDQGEGMNVTVLLFRPGQEIDFSMVPMMHWQSGLFGRGTYNHVLRNQLSSALSALDRELRIVGAIQRSLLRRELPGIPGYEIAAHYQTSAHAGGDYYDFFPLEKDHWGLFIGDVSGHGTPAAVLMAITHAIAHSQPGKHTPPPALLTHLNDQLASVYTRDESFVTAFYSVLDPDTGSLTYSSAGHPPPRLVRGSEVVSLDKTGSLPLGINEGERYGQAAATLERGDLLLLYTDGITETGAPESGPHEGELFGMERLDRVLVECRSASPDECIERIQRELAEFCGGASPTDDQTLIAIRRV